MPEELAAPKVPRKELGLDDSRSNTPQGFPSAGGHKGPGATTAAMLGKTQYPLYSVVQYISVIHKHPEGQIPMKFECI